jgi:BMFP domain-containing protein YqiC
MEPHLIDDLAQRLMSRLPDNVRSLQTDLEANFKSVLQSTLTKMNLVSREEFDIQAAVLQRTREKLETLLQRLSELEQNTK